MMQYEFLVLNGVHIYDEHCSVNSTTYCPSWIVFSMIRWVRDLARSFVSASTFAAVDRIVDRIVGFDNDLEFDFSFN